MNLSLKKKERSSNIEIYRIISMILIIAHHYVVNSGLMERIESDILAPKSLFFLCFGAWGKIGINCFVLITGYFMCKAEISLRKFAKLLLEVMFYKIIIGAIFLAVGYIPFTLEWAVKIILPFYQVSQNFTGTYLIFFLFIPFLNVLIRNLNEKQHLKLLCLALFTYTFMGSIPKAYVAMNYVSWYMVLYIVSSYIRLYPKKIFEKTKVWGILTLISVLLVLASVILGTYVGTKIGYSLTYFFVTDSNKILALWMGICSFMFFKNLNIKNSKFINAVSSTTFGVLLIHANSDFMRNWLWRDVLNNVQMYDSKWLYLHAVVSVICIFIVCSIIDYLRIRFVEKYYMKLFSSIHGRVSKPFNRFKNYAFERLNIK